MPLKNGVIILFLSNYLNEYEMKSGQGGFFNAAPGKALMFLARLKLPGSNSEE
jgi:hypothetical protein